MLRIFVSMKKISICFILLIFPLIFVAQGHGIPTGLERMFMQGSCITDSIDNAIIHTGFFISHSGSAFNGNGKYESSLNFSDYYRLGTWFSIDRRLYKKISVGFTIPYIYLTVKRNTTYYPAGTFSSRGIPEVKLRIGYASQHKKLEYYTGIFTGIPVQKGKSAFASPEIYIGNDSFWNLGIDAGFSYRPQPVFGVYTDVVALYRVPRNGTLIAENQALIASSDAFSSFQASIGLRSFFTVNAGILFRLKLYNAALGYEFYGESADNISNVLPDGYLEETATLDQLKGARAWSHSITAGVTRKLANIKVGLMFKTSVNGSSTFNEKMLMFMAGFNL